MNSPADNKTGNMVLTRVTRHEILKKRERVLIDLHEVLEGRTERPFAAIPVTASGLWGDKKFWGTGYSAQEALSGCMEKIRDADSSSLFPPPDGGSEK